MFALCATNAVDGALRVVFRGSEVAIVIYLAATVVSVICVVLWCGFDAAARGLRFTGSDRVWIVLLGLVGVPRSIYLKGLRLNY